MKKPIIEVNDDTDISSDDEQIVTRNRAVTINA